MPSNAAARPLVALLATLTLMLALAAGGCGGATLTSADPDRLTTSVAPPNVPFAKAKFVLHLGLAFGAFHRYISRPLERGAFGPRAPQRLSAWERQRWLPATSASTPAADGVNYEPAHRGKASRDVLGAGLATQSPPSRLPHRPQPVDHRGQG